MDDFTDIPLAVVTVSKNRLTGGRIAIPADLINDDFDARIWAAELCDQVKHLVRFSGKAKDNLSIIPKESPEIESICVEDSKIRVTFAKK